MYGDVTNIKTKCGDRRITVTNYGEALLTVARTAPGASQYAYLTPLGARQLIDALEFFAEQPIKDCSAEAPAPELHGAEWLTGPTPTTTRYIILYRHRGGWRQSVRGSLRHTFKSRDDAERARRQTPGADSPCDYRIVSING